MLGERRQYVLRFCTLHAPQLYMHTVPVKRLRGGDASAESNQMTECCLPASAHTVGQSDQVFYTQALTLRVLLIGNTAR
jgi:hypothetical protein